MTNGEIIENRRLKGDYFLARFFAPEISRKARAGQFVHVRINRHGDRILRRPFSIHNCEGDVLSVVYKVVGHGTRELSELAPEAVCDLMGPLGVAFTDPAPGVTPVLVAGGYGAAATYLLTKQAPQRGIFLLGARGEADIRIALKGEFTLYSCDTSGKRLAQVPLSKEPDGTIRFQAKVFRPEGSVFVYELVRK